MKTTAGSGDLRHVLGGFGEYSGNVLHIVPVPMSFLRDLLWATVRGQYSGLEWLSVCSGTVFIKLLPSGWCFWNEFFSELLLDFVWMRFSWNCSKKWRRGVSWQLSRVWCWGCLPVPFLRLSVNVPSRNTCTYYRFLQHRLVQDRDQLSTVLKLITPNRFLNQYFIAL